VPRRSRPQVDPTGDWQQLRLLTDWPEQLAYELIRPVVLFGRSPAQRAQETGTAERTLRRKARRFDQAGMVSLFTDETPEHATDRRCLPPPLRQLIVDLKAEYPAFRMGAIAQSALSPSLGGRARTSFSTSWPRVRPRSRPGAATRATPTCSIRRCGAWPSSGSTPKAGR
jgi:hypothetical protein